MYAGMTTYSITLLKEKCRARLFVIGKGWSYCMISTCLSICLSDRCLYCDKTKRCTADNLIPHEMAITLVFWHQHWLVGCPRSLWNIRRKWPTPHAKLIVLYNQYFICIQQMGFQSHYSCLVYSDGVSSCTEPLAVLAAAQWTFWT